MPSSSYPVGDASTSNNKKMSITDEDGGTRTWELRNTNHYQREISKKMNKDELIEELAERVQVDAEDLAKMIAVKRCRSAFSTRQRLAFGAFTW